MATKTRQVRQDIVDTIDAMEPLSAEQLRELIRFEAEDIGLTFDQAIEAAREGTLPKNSIGFDLGILIRFLHRAEELDVEGT